MDTFALFISDQRSEHSSAFFVKGDQEPECSTENRFRGTIARINEGKVTTVFVVRIPDGTELCSVVTTKASKGLKLQEDDTIWVIFNCFSVVLHAD